MTFIDLAPGFAGARTAEAAVATWAAVTKVLSRGSSFLFFSFLLRSTKIAS